MAKQEHLPQNFAAQAEAVFRRQNNATSRVMMLSLEEWVNPESAEALLSAEKSMQIACELLNQYAIQSQTESSSSLMLRARAGKSVTSCDHATQTLEKLLENLDLAATNAKPDSE